MTRDAIELAQGFVDHERWLREIGEVADILNAPMFDIDNISDEMLERYEDILRDSISEGQN